MTAALLLDTHILLWVRAAPDRLLPVERALIDGASLRLISAVSLWEIATLMGLGRIANDQALLDVPAGFELLPIQPEHCAVYAALPRLHRDPFDRMLIAQSRCEQVPLLTRDKMIPLYGEEGALLVKGT